MTNIDLFYWLTSILVTIGNQSIKLIKIKVG